MFSEVTQQGIERFEVTWSLLLAWLLMIPYLAWGIYALIVRFRWREELQFPLKIATVVALFLFYIVEIRLIIINDTEPVNFVFAIAGLMISGAALYGPLTVSLLSHMMVNLVMPASQPVCHEPQYGAAEACERTGDYEGAVREYIALARMFPKEPKILLRAGDNLMKLGQLEDAAAWFERGLAALHSAERSLPVVNRLHDIYSRHLNWPDKARHVLEGYLEKYPDSEYSALVRARLSRKSMRTPPPRPAITLQEAEGPGTLLED